MAFPHAVAGLPVPNPFICLVLDRATGIPNGIFHTTGNDFCTLFQRIAAVFFGTFRTAHAAVAELFLCFFPAALDSASRQLCERCAGARLDSALRDLSFLWSCHIVTSQHEKETP
jgi:hypothetical protein